MHKVEEIFIIYSTLVIKWASYKREQNMRKLNVTNVVTAVRAE